MPEVRYYWGQTFTSELSGTLANIDVWTELPRSTPFVTYNLPPQVEIRFHGFVGGTMNSLHEASVTAPTEGITLQPSWLSASFIHENLTIEAGQQYGFSMVYDSSNNQRLSFLLGSSYPDGDKVWSQTSVISFSTHPSENDMGFRVTVVPEPATFTLLGLGSLALVVVGRRSQ